MPSFRNIGSDTGTLTGGKTRASLAVPTSSPGDMLVAVMSGRGAEAIRVDTPSGWTKRVGSAQGDDGENVFFYMFTKPYVAADSGTTVYFNYVRTADGTTAEAASYVAHMLSVAPSVALAGVRYAGSYFGAAGGGAVTLSVIPVHFRTLCVGAAGVRMGAAGTGPGWTAPSGWTERGDNNNGTFGEQSECVDTIETTTIQTLAAPAFTPASSGDDSKAGVLVFMDYLNPRSPIYRGVNVGTRRIA